MRIVSAGSIAAPRRVLTPASAIGESAGYPQSPYTAAMSIFETIKSAIFGHGAGKPVDATTGTAATSSPGSGGPPATPTAPPAGAPSPVPGPAGGGGAGGVEAQL